MSSSADTCQGAKPEEAQKKKLVRPEGLEVARRHQFGAGLAGTTFLFSANPPLLPPL